MWAVYIDGELQYPLYHDELTSEASVYHEEKDAARRAREFREANPGHKVEVRKVKLVRVKK